jgi:hypothetical protein
MGHLCLTRFGAIMTDDIMTLLEAVESLALIEVNAVSWINVMPVDNLHVAVFTIAFVLPFLDPELPYEFRAGKRKCWPDQKRLLGSAMPIEYQILELHRTQTLGNLAPVYLRPTEGQAQGLWAIKPHAGDDRERLTWMEAVIGLEGRFPVWISKQAHHRSTGTFKIS